MKRYFSPLVVFLFMAVMVCVVLYVDRHKPTSVPVPKPLTVRTWMVKPPLHYTQAEEVAYMEAAANGDPLPEGWTYVNDWASMPVDVALGSIQIVGDITGRDQDGHPAMLNVKAGTSDFSFLVTNDLRRSDLLDAVAKELRAQGGIVWVDSDTSELFVLMMGQFTSLGASSTDAGFELMTCVRQQ